MNVIFLFIETSQKYHREHLLDRRPCSAELRQFVGLHPMRKFLQQKLGFSLPAHEGEGERQVVGVSESRVRQQELQTFKHRFATIKINLIYKYKRTKC